MKTIARVLLLVLLLGASAGAADPPRSVVLNFDNADIEVVVQAVAEIVGFNYVFGPNVRGRKVTLQTTGKIPREEVLDFLLTVLDVNGLTAVKADNVYRIITGRWAARSSPRSCPSSTSARPTRWRSCARSSPRRAR
jgi:type II secretory pathway component GspD/PulD (secretin)